MTLDNEAPSAMLQQAYSIPYDAYQIEMWNHMLAGLCVGAWLALTVTFALLAINDARHR